MVYELKEFKKNKNLGGALFVIVTEGRKPNLVFKLAGCFKMQADLWLFTVGVSSIPISLSLEYLGPKSCQEKIHEYHFIHNNDSCY